MANAITPTHGWGRVLFSTFLQRQSAKMIFEDNISGTLRNAATAMLHSNSDICEKSACPLYILAKIFFIYHRPFCFCSFHDSVIPVQRANARLDWDGVVAFLVQRARGVGGGRRAKDPYCSFSAQGVIATGRRLREGRIYPVMLTAPDLKSLREKHNAHLLDEIVAIQPFLAKTPFTGCGLFETEFERKGCKRSAQAALGTYELLQWPEEDVKWFDIFDPPLGGSADGDSWFDRPAARGGVTFAEQRKRRSSSAKRVHGILHRILATTTTQMVEHVEREVRFSLLFRRTSLRRQPLERLKELRSSVLWCGRFSNTCIMLCALLLNTEYITARRAGVKSTRCEDHNSRYSASTSNNKRLLSFTQKNTDIYGHPTM